MNKKLKEFAVQSDLWRMLDEYSWEFGSCDPEKDCGRIEKFAQLIIKECVRHFNEDYQRDFDTNWREDLSKSIKQHFGVEE
jgi:hypothetical protein